jgi:hypothetical protein
MNKFLLPPIAESLLTVASQSSIVELVATHLMVETMSRDMVVDIIFIISLLDLETGMVHISFDMQLMMRATFLVLQALYTSLTIGYSNVSCN